MSSSINSINSINNLSEELISKIFYYIGNTNNYVIELKKKISSLTKNKFLCDKNDDTYEYDSYIDESKCKYVLEILYSNCFNEYTYNHEFNISKALLLAITRKKTYIPNIDIICVLKFDIFECY
jgi:hypothetical protein